MNVVKINDERFLTPADYQQQEGIKSLKTVYNMINRGELETRKLLGKTLIKV